MALLRLKSIPAFHEDKDLENACNEVFLIFDTISKPQAIDLLKEVVANSKPVTVDSSVSTYPVYDVKEFFDGSRYFMVEIRDER